MSQSTKLIYVSIVSLPGNRLMHEVISTRNHGSKYQNTGSTGCKL